MRRYSFRILGGRGTQDDPLDVIVSDSSAAMLRAVTMCAEIGCSDGFHRGFAVSVWDEHGAAIGRVAIDVTIRRLGAAR